MPLYISLEANEFFDEFDFHDNSLHFNRINEPVAECTDNVQEFLDNFGFLDDLEPFTQKKHIPSIAYDDDTVPLLDEPTETTAPLSFSDSDTSAGNASDRSDLDYFEDECFDIEEIQFNYLGPKILKTAPTGETPATILTANTVGLAKSRRLFRVLLDSGSTVCMIKRSCLPKHAVLTELTKKKSVRT